MARPCFLLLLLPLPLLHLPLAAISKSTIEPCSGSDACSALVGYTLYADLKVAELGALFQVDSAALLTANAIDPAAPGAYNHILPSGLFLRIPVLCSCADGIRKSVSTRYKTRPADTLASIAGSVFAGLASPDQIREANNIADPGALDVGQNLVIPLPCTCFNNTDNLLPAVYLSYVVRPGDTVPAIAAEYATTVTDIMNANAMGSPVANNGDILAIPLPVLFEHTMGHTLEHNAHGGCIGQSSVHRQLHRAMADAIHVGIISKTCSSMLPSYASDYGLIVANGSYAVTASHCVQCSCGPGDLNLYCTPASLSASCSSMQCSKSNLMLGNVVSQPTSGGCNVVSCTYGGFVNGSIVTSLSSSLQPRCPGPHQFPSLKPPPSEAIQESFLAPSPSPVLSQPGGAMPTPKPSSPGTSALPGVSPANGPSGSVSAAPCIDPSNRFLDVFFLCLFLRFLL